MNAARSGRTAPSSIPSMTLTLLLRSTPRPERGTTVKRLLFGAAAAIVFPVSEEREIVVVDPAQERRAFAQFFLRDGG